MAKTSAFDRQVAEYDAWFDTHNDLYQTELAALRSLLPVTVKVWKSAWVPVDLLCPSASI